MRTMRRIRTTTTATMIAIVPLDRDPDVYDNFESQSEPVVKEPKQEDHLKCYY